MDVLVLIAEDHADTREGYEAYLKMLGARVASTGRGDDAVRLVLELRPDVIIMDRHMPGLSGDEATQCLRADARTRAIPIIALTGSDPIQHAGDADRFLLKPCLPTQLADLIREVLGIDEAGATGALLS
jgi:CheY-like chemotaxis protein